MLRIAFPQKPWAACRAARRGTLCLRNCRPRAGPVAPKRAAAPLQAISPRLAALDAAVLAAAAAACFSLLAADVSSAQPVLRALDCAVHTWVAATVSPELRASLFEQALSDAPLAAALLCSLGTSSSLFGQLPTGRRAAVAGLLVATLAFGSPVPLGDWGALGAAKAAFSRERPTTLGASLSFPSGHTAITAYHSLLFATVLHPRRRAAGEDPSAVDASLVPLAGGAIAVVAASRVLADVHWVTDVVAGAAFGAGLAMAVAAVTAALETMDGANDP